MPYVRKSKRNSKTSRHRRRPRRKRQPKLLTKSLKNALSKIVSQKLDAAIEDKYVLDSSFVSKVSSYDSSTKTILFNISPNIANGDEVNQRTGNKVRLKYLRSMIRFLPQKKHVQYTADGVPSYVANWIPDLPACRVFIVKINQELAMNMTATELRTALNAKFRSAGHMWQDYAQSTGKRAMSAIKLLSKCVLKQKYRTIAGSINPIYASGSITETSFTLTPTYQMQSTITSVPQFSYKNLLVSSVAQKVEMEDTYNSVLKYQYWMFVQLGNGFNDDTYDPVESPTQFDIRNCWVYEDA